MTRTGRSRAKSQLMMEASSTGEAGVRRAHENLMAEKSRTLGHGLAAAQQVGQAVGDAQARGWQGENVKKAEAAAAEKEQFERDYKVGEQALSQQRIDVDVAKAGLEPTGDQTRPPLLNDKQQRLRDEMDRAEQENTRQGPGQQGSGQQGPGQQGQPPPSQREVNFAQQGQESLEPAGTRGGFKASAQTMQARQMEQRIQQTETAAKMQNAEANLLNARANYQKAQTEGNAEKAKAANDQMDRQLEVYEGMINDLQSGKLDPNQVASGFGDNPQIAQMLESKQPISKARMAQMLRTKIAQTQISNIAVTGVPPVGMDPTNPVVQRYNSLMNEVGAAFRGSQMNSISPGQTDQYDQAAQNQGVQGMIQAWQGIASYQERQSFLHQTTAKIFMEAASLQQNAQGPRGSGLRQRVSDLEKQNSVLQNELLRAQQTNPTGVMDRLEQKESEVYKEKGVDEQTGRAIGDTRPPRQGSGNRFAGNLGTGYAPRGR